MKHIFAAMCALALLMAGCTPALAAEAPKASPSAEPERSCYYPIRVDEYTAGPLDELRIDKVYQLSLGDDPSGIPTEDFTRNGRLYYLLDMVRKDEVGVDTQTHTETVTLASDTDKMDAILQRLEGEMEFTTEDGYTGILRLDHTSVQVTTDGYASKTTSLSATRTYPNLSEADVSLVPKTINDKGRILTLADVQWSSAESTDGEGGIATHYTATASYSGSATSRYATGYTVTANYTGEVSNPYFPSGTPGRFAARYYDFMRQCYPLQKDGGLRHAWIEQTVQYIKFEGKRGAEQLEKAVAGLAEGLPDNAAVQEAAAALIGELKQYQGQEQTTISEKKHQHKRSQER